MKSIKTPEDSARLYISEEYHEHLLKEIGPADSLMERVFLDGVKFGYEWMKQRHAEQLGQAYPAGYKAAQERYEAKIKELETELDNWQHAATHGDEGL